MIAEPTSAAIWNPHAFLRCVSCGAEQDAGSIWMGCGVCGDARPLVVGYRSDLIGTVASASEPLLPVERGVVLELGQGHTPLVDVPSLAPNLFLKLEGQNPTGSHKDRFHALAVGLAVALGYRGVVTSSTGNHGAAAAAFAARAGLPAVIFIHPKAPEELRSQIRAYGGILALIPERAAELLAAMVDEGWYPSTSADPGLAGRANPYGSEAYKAIAYEIVDQLGTPPDVIAIPAASGDTLYGVWRGFRELHERRGLTMPRVLACQPAGAASLAVTSPGGAPGVIADAQSLALSTADGRSGWHAASLLREGVVPVTASDDDIAAAVRDLGRAGFCVEPAAALPLACLRLEEKQPRFRSEERAVALVTSSGLNWTRDVDAAWGAAPKVITSADELREVARDVA